MLAAAYRTGLVPQHLHGRTQHKTLQARLSEDIIERRDQSAFFRTAPGRFFLREFLADTTISEEYRQPVPTRRRIRELIRGPALAISQGILDRFIDDNIVIDPNKIYGVLRSGSYYYGDPRIKDDSSVFVRSFVCVIRDSHVLTYRTGAYRENRDTFTSKRSIGFSTLVNIDEHTLFNMKDLGIVDSGVRAAKIDLDIPDISTGGGVSASLNYFVWIRQNVAPGDLLAIVTLECPAWFEPVRRRLALNDLSWLDTSKAVNNIDDFDPWSKFVLLSRYKANLGHYAEVETQSSLSRPAQQRLHKVPT